MPFDLRPRRRERRLSGGSPVRNRSVSRTAPTFSERDHAGSPSRVPTTASAEPPPTSQTATHSGSDLAAATAPANASRPSFGGKHADRSPRGGRELTHEAVAVRALASGCGDDHVERLRAERPRTAREVPGAAGCLADAGRGKPAMPLDLLPEEQVLPPRQS